MINLHNVSKLHANRNARSLLKHITMMMYLGKLTYRIYFERILNGGICNPQLKQSVVGKLQCIKYDENMLVKLMKKL